MALVKSGSHNRVHFHVPSIVLGLGACKLLSLELRNSLFHSRVPLWRCVPEDDMHGARLELICPRSHRYAGQLLVAPAVLMRVSTPSSS